ncbi:amidohydrolase family protein, partial [Methylobacterium frigidaeris]|uniref:amidohydrolase family protein n=1 Tax=Methylobacterium frigidaeris TaxID=2038277 RepID=UPI001EDECB3D
MAMSRRDLGKAMYGAVLGSASADAPPGDVTLIRGGYVMTMDAARGDLPEADILVRDGCIAEIGRSLTAPAGADIVEAVGAVVLPGFIDAHTHGSISQMRGLYRNTPETAFFPITNRLSAHYTLEDTYLGMLLSAIESAASGITTTADFFDNVRDREHAEAGFMALRRCADPGETALRDEEQDYHGPDRSRPGRGMAAGLGGALGRRAPLSRPRLAPAAGPRRRAGLHSRRQYRVAGRQLVPCPERQVRSQDHHTPFMVLPRFVVRGLCKYSGCDSLVGEGSRRQAAQG